MGHKWANSAYDRSLIRHVLRDCFQTTDYFRVEGGCAGAHATYDYAKWWAGRNAAKFGCGFTAFDRSLTIKFDGGAKVQIMKASTDL